MPFRNLVESLLVFPFKGKMLTKKDLRWTNKFFSIYSILMVIPVTFKPVMLGGDGGQMESGSVSNWRRIGFKITQSLALCQTLFIIFRTLEYMVGGNLDLNWDFVPVERTRLWVIIMNDYGYNVLMLCCIIVLLIKNIWYSMTSDLWFWFWWVIKDYIINYY